MFAGDQGNIEETLADQGSLVKHGEALEVYEGLLISLEKRVSQMDGNWKGRWMGGWRCGHGIGAGVLQRRIHRIQSSAMMAHVKRGSKQKRPRALQGGRWKRKRKGSSSVDEWSCAD